MTEVPQRYLDLLDQYQTIRKSLNGHLSDGYISLSQANFSNSNRIRHGQDFYDDRMEASIRVSFEGANALLKIMDSGSVSISSFSNADEDSSQSTTKPADESDDPPPPEPELVQKSPCDPLNWFGMFVPPTLRASQSSFKGAIMDDAPSLVIIMKDLKETEIEIRRARKKLKKAN